MPLRPLHHNLLKSHVQTPSSSLKPVVDQGSIQEPDYFDSIDKLGNWGTGNGGSESNFEGGAKFSSSSQAQVKRVHPSIRSQKPKLLVCHDFKGGYTEDPFEQGYSFEFWHLVDTFIYFSHNRITIPPRGWLNAGRRHVSKILGTVIFEWAESKPDLQECLYGELLDSAQPSMMRTTDTSARTFSTKYASYLVTLAQVRKFDGYLLNIETDLNFIPPVSSYPGKSQGEQDEDAVFLERERSLAGLGVLLNPDAQARRAIRMDKNVNALLGWVKWLREEGKSRIGPHWEVIWYDSVTTTGRLEWQDALTPANAPFFMNSDAIFTNYTWARPPDRSPPGAFPERARPQIEHHPAILKSASMAESLHRSTCDIYVGIDVFGRNCYGGFAVGSSLDMIFPSRNSNLRGGSHGAQFLPGEDGRHDLGLSVALFAPGWTWERDKEGGGKRTWSEWWEGELQFWFGRITSEMQKESVPNGVSTFFGPRDRSLLRTAPTLDASPPTVEVHDTALFLGRKSAASVGGQTLHPSSVFYTNFNRGSGNSWWVCGHRVYDALLVDKDEAGRHGWTDMGSCFPKPDRIWPCPTPLHLEDRDRGATAVFKSSGDDQVTIKAALIHHDVWEGGESLEIDIHLPEHPDHTPITDSSGESCTVLPLCTLHACHLALSDSHTLEIVIKRLSLSLDVRPCILWSDSEPAGRNLYRAAQVSSGSAKVHELANGWCSVAVIAQLDRASPHLPVEVVPVLALEIGYPLGHSANRGVASADLKLIVGAISLVPTVPLSPPASLRFHDAVLPPPHLVNSPEPHDSSSQTSSSNALLWKPVPLPNGAPRGTLWGILTWELRETEATPTTGYYNIFASRRSPEKMGSEPDDADYLWLGTSTYESDPNTFVVAGLEPSDIAVRHHPTVPAEGGSYTQVGVLPGSGGSSGHAPPHIYFVVERAGFVGGLIKEGIRYVCKVEY